MKNALVSISILVILLFVACSENSTESNDDAIPYTKLTEGYNNATKIEVYVEKTPFVGYNKIYIAVYDSANNERIKYSQITLAPMMDMGTMIHASPFENPTNQEAVDGLFPGAITFIMSGMWQLNVSFQHADNNDTGSVHFEFDVEAASLVKKVDGTDGKKYFVTLIEPEKWQVGTAPIEFCVNSKQSMMNFPAEESMTIEMEPWMDMGDGMGHGSSENTNPVHQGIGHYLGQVHYTMTGVWDINLAVSNGDSVIVETSFEVTVE